MPAVVSPDARQCAMHQSYSCRKGSTPPIYACFWPCACRSTACLCRKGRRLHALAAPTRPASPADLMQTRYSATQHTGTEAQRQSAMLNFVKNKSPRVIRGAVTDYLRLMAYPLDIPAGAKLRVSGVLSAFCARC